MSAMAATYPSQSSSTPSRSTRRRVSVDEVAYLVRKRATKLDTPLPTAELVQRALVRFNSAFDGTASPADLDGWIRRTLREIVVAEQRARSARPSQTAEEVRLLRVLEGLAAPVRSPALAKERKLLLRRVTELIGGPECRVVLAMIAETSVDEVAAQLALPAVDVVQLQRRGLQRLQRWLTHDHQLAQQLREASRQPKRARTSH